LLHFLKALINLDPGTIPIWVHLTFPVAVTAAGAVKKPLSASCYGADPGGEIKNTIPTAATTLIPYAVFLRHSHKQGIESGENRGIREALS
jgi:hypothetical protein